MNKTPITDSLKDQFSAETLELDDLFSAHEKLELAANKLHSRLSIWVNTANAAVRGYSNMEDIEALAEFELLRKP